jgi:hypothetical protein
MKLRTMVVWAMVVVVVGAAGCTSRRRQRPAQAQAPAVTWQLMEPPQEPNDQYPRGYRVLSDAPFERWQPQESYASLEECTKAMRERVDRFIDSARVAVGADAKNDLAVRRAVHAKCVQLQPGAAPPSPAKR